MAPWKALLALFTVYLLTVPGTALCYYPDGSPSEDFPCSSDVNSTCCGQGYTCMSNSICKSNSYTFSPGSDNTQYIRGSCTDKSFTSSSCPLFCLVKGVDQLDGGQDMIKCPDASGDVYVCNTETVPWSCDNNKDTLEFQGTPSGLTTIGVTATSSGTSMSTSMTKTASTLTTSTVSVSSSTEAVSATATADSSDSSHAGAKIGGGVAGGAATLLLLIALAIMLWRSRRSRKVQQSTDKKKELSPPPYTDTMRDQAAKNGTMPAEVEAREIPQELNSEERYEAPGAEMYHELPA